MNLKDIQIRDPFVVVENDTYHLFGSTDKDIWKPAGTGFDAYTSRDLHEFDGPFPVFRPPPDFWSVRNFWAPEVYKTENGDYIMFATFLPKTGCRGTAALKSAGAILGPYLPWSDGPLTPHDWECLDGTLYYEGGVPWMVFCHEWQQIGNGEICAMPLNRDLRTAAGKPSILFRAGDAAWAAPLKGRAPGSYVTDGPFLWRLDENNLIMLWSSFGEDGRYRLGIARSKTGLLAGPWQQDAAPFFAADGGHGMLFHSLEGKLLLALHTPNATPHERALFVETVL